MFHDESSKSIYFVSKGQRSRSWFIKNGVAVILCTLLSADCFWFNLVFQPFRCIVYSRLCYHSLMPRACERINKRKTSCCLLRQVALHVLCTKLLMKVYSQQLWQNTAEVYQKIVQTGSDVSKMWTVKRWGSFVWSTLYTIDDPDHLCYMLSDVKHQ